MAKKLLAAAALSVAVTAPGASATAPAFDCRLANLAQETVTGGHETFEGIAMGYVVASEPAVPTSIRCFVRVDGTEVDSTPVGTGTGAGTTAGQITYTASDNQVVELCAEYTAGWGSQETLCWDTLLFAPPDEAGRLCGAVLGPDICHALGFKVDPR